MIAKVLNKDTSLTEKIRILFQEQGITVAPIITAFGMAIGVLVEALLSGGDGAGTAGKPPPKDGKSLTEWIRNKLKALARLLETLPGINGVILADVVGWVLQNLWALVVGIVLYVHGYQGKIILQHIVI